MKLTNPDKVFWPKERYTKGDLAVYYQKIAPWLLPHLKNRPLSLHRYPDGIHGTRFFQKDVSALRTPTFVRTVSIRMKNGSWVRHVVCNNKKTLLYLANLGVITFHPWASRVGTLNRPDYAILDIDPPRGRSFDDVVTVGQVARAILEAANIPSLVKTSGKTGLHIVVPLHTRYTYKRARRLAKLIALRIHERLPRLTTIKQRLSKRRGKIYLDTGRNAFGQTAAAPYAVRARQGATVSTPLTWSEVRRGLDPRKFTIKTILARVRAKGDPWKSLGLQSANLEKAEALLRHAKP